MRVPCDPISQQIESTGNKLDRDPGRNTKNGNHTGKGCPALPRPKARILSQRNRKPLTVRPDTCWDWIPGRQDNCIENCKSFCLNWRGTKESLSPSVDNLTVGVSNSNPISRHLCIRNKGTIAMHNLTERTRR
ncbi:unnamed protein product [Linum trigynum]|uniref:Uncharacterized protein n=1 Tax=Linum trigynum TaxID=586398 RepID=A0AAV2GRT5_9ROSI